MATTTNPSYLYLVDDLISCFGDNYIGIRGVCDEKPPYTNLYIDDFPGINLLNAAKTADSVIVKGEDLLNRCIHNAIRATSSDFTALMASSTKGLQFNSQVAEQNIFTAGSDSFTEKADVLARIKIEKSCTNNPFEKLRISDFALFAKDVIDCVDFKVKTSEIDEGSDFHHVFNKGYNRLDFEFMSDVEFVSIEFSLANLQVGQKSNYSKYHNACWKNCCNQSANPCVYITTEISEDDGVTWVSNDTIAFNATIQCVNDISSMSCYYKQELSLPIFYKAASFFIKEVLFTDRVNEYTENSKEGLKNLLTSIDGGIDMVAGHKISSDYWRHLKSAVENCALSAKHLQGRNFRSVGNRITNQVPR